MLSLEINVGYKTNHMSVRAYLDTLLSQRGSISPVERSNMILNCFHHLTPIYYYYFDHHCVINRKHYKTREERKRIHERIEISILWVWIYTDYLYCSWWFIIPSIIVEDITYISYQLCFTDSGVSHPYSLESFSASPRRAAVCISFLGIQPTF